MFLGFGKPRTKADWDEIIKDLYRQLENAQGRLECDKSMYGNKQPAVIAADKNTIAHIKANIEKAKINRRNASGGNTESSSSTPAVSRKRNTSGGSERNAQKEIRDVIMLYIEENTTLSRAEMRDEIINKYNYSISDYLEVEKRLLVPKYCSWISASLNKEKVSRKDMETLGRLLDRDVNADLQVLKKKRKKRGATRTLAIFMGMFGIDRYYLGQVGKGILKMFTAGGFVIWWLYDIFTAGERTDDYNYKMYREYITKDND